MARVSDDLTRLIEFSLTKSKQQLAVELFPMFTQLQISRLYEITARERKMLLANRQAMAQLKASLGESRRSPEQSTKMAEIATDPSNR